MAEVPSPDAAPAATEAGQQAPSGVSPQPAAIPIPLTPERHSSDAGSSAPASPAAPALQLPVVDLIGLRFSLQHLRLVGYGLLAVWGSEVVNLLTTPRPTRAECMEPPRFVPELASLEQLLEHFRRTGSKLAIAVDEYGGTAGIVALEDCVEEIVGDIADVGEVAVDAPLEVAAGVWRVSGEMSVARWSEIFGARAVSARSSTVAGIVLQRLSRLARTGDKVDLANVRIEVEKVEGARIRSVLVSLQREVA